MKILFRKSAFLTSLFAISVAIPVTLLQAEEVDFSCMSYLVKGKIQVSEHLKEYDIVLENHCPGTVHWSMCIERMEPWTNEVQEALTPSGILEKDKKSRVNLQMKKRLDESRSRQAFREFYLQVGYAIKPPAIARCVAKGCEAKRRSLRTKFRANDAAWQRAKKTQTARISTECPQSGWDSDAQDACTANIRKSSLASMKEFAQKEKEIVSKISAVGLEECQIHGGG